MQREAAATSLNRLIDASPPAAGAVVMATGAVSIALSYDAHETLSRILLVIGGLTWILLVALLPVRAFQDVERFRAEVRTPPALTSVAGSAVLGTRLTLLGWKWAGIAWLVLALVLWLGLLTPILTHWATPTVGVSLMLTVSTESLAVLAVSLAAAEHANWLLAASLAPFVLGLGFYVFVISRFDLHQLLVGHGDHWITGGALAISTLAAARITSATTSLHTLTSLTPTLKTVSLVLWTVTIAWLPVLLVAEALAPRLHYELQRWSTVFPVGMYAACSFLVGTAAGVVAISDFGRVWVWVALAVWVIVFGAMLRRAPQIV